MTYTVQVGGGGYLGWKLLERTSVKQRATFEQDTQIQRAKDYFTAKISGVKQADELVSDYRLMQVALRAFGLDADIGNRLFIKKVLQADPENKSSFVNKLTDKRYLALNKAFGFGAQGNDASSALNVDRVLDLYLTRSFEKNIGERHQEIELALNAQRELPTLAATNSSENTKWYQILGSPPLRKIFEGAFGLGASFGQLSVDRQVSEMKLRLQRQTGSSDVSQFSDPEKLSDLLKRYFLRTQTSSINIASPYSAALTILRGGK